MTGLTRRHEGHAPRSLICLSRAYRPNTARPSVAKMTPAISRQGVWDGALDGSAPKGAPSHRLGMELLAIVARLGLSLFLTAGFTAGLSLNIGTSLATPNMVQTCEWFFFWSLALISCVTSRRA
jgi:hypothetical protein